MGSGHRATRAASASVAAHSSSQPHTKQHSHPSRAVSGITSATLPVSTPLATTVFSASLASAAADWSASTTLPVEPPPPVGGAAADGGGIVLTASAAALAAPAAALVAAAVAAVAVPLAAPGAPPAAATICVAFSASAAYLNANGPLMDATLPASSSANAVTTRARRPGWPSGHTYASSVLQSSGDVRWHTWRKGWAVSMQGVASRCAQASTSTHLMILSGWVIGLTLAAAGLATAFPGLDDSAGTGVLGALLDGTVGAAVEKGRARTARAAAARALTTRLASNRQACSAARWSSTPCARSIL